MTTRKVLVRPAVRTYVQWTGDNLAEVETVMGRTIPVENDELVFPMETIAIGGWCTPDDISAITTEQLDWQQTVSGTGPFAFAIIDESE
jgi:hypothetical protein